MEIRLSTLRQAVKIISNDDARYALAEKVRELGYIDVADFLAANPPEQHVGEIERLLAI